MFKDIITEKSYLFGLFKRTESARNVTASKNSDIIVQLVKEFTDRTRAEVKKWRQAMDMADNPENPRWNLLQDIFENLMDDGHLEAVFTIRKAATLSTRFYIRDKKTGKEIPEATEFLETEWFFFIMESILDAVFRAYTVLEFVDPLSFDFECIPRRNIAPQNHRVYFEVSGNKFVNYNDPSFQKNILFYHDRRHKFGLINKIIPQLIWKRNAKQTWADFSEKFGIPLVTAETVYSDTKSLDKIEKAMREMGQQMGAVFPEGSKINIHDQTTKGDPFKIFQEQIKDCNEEISKAFLGGTMITDSGSSRSQSEVHERTFDNKIAESDKRIIQFFINNKVIPLLRLWGVKIPETAQFVFDRTESISVIEHWKIVKDALGEYEIPDEWISNRFNFPIVGRKQQQKTQPVQQKIKAFSENFL